MGRSASQRNLCRSPIVAAKLLKRADELSYPAFRPKAQIHPKQIPLVRHLRERVRDVLSQSAKIRAVGKTRARASPPGPLGRTPVRSADIDQVHVRAEIQLAAAQLSHAENSEAALGEAITFG